MHDPTQKQRDSDTPVLREQLCFALYTASHHVIRAYRPLLDPLGLTYVQYLVIIVLREQSPLSVGEMGVHLHLDSGTLTPLLKRMESASLVNRTRDPDDERRVLVELTEDGEVLGDKAAEIADNMLCKIDLSQAEAQQLRNRIMALVDTLT